jgi:hypothetical protein
MNQSECIPTTITFLNPCQEMRGDSSYLDYQNAYVDSFSIDNYINNWHNCVIFSKLSRRCPSRLDYRRQESPIKSLKQQLII